MSYPFSSQLPAPGQFNVQLLERTLLWQAAAQLSHNCQAQPDMIVLTTLAATSAAVQGRFDIMMPYGTKKPVSLATLIVADSGEGKSVVYDKVMGPIKDVQSEQYGEYRQLLDTHLSELEEWKTEKQVIIQAIYRKRAKGGSAETEKQNLRDYCKLRPQPPREFRLLYQDTTPEALFQGLQTAIPTAALATDEAEVFLKSSMSHARGHMNTLWSGGDTIVTRVTKDNILLQNVRLMFLLMVQPGILDAYLAQQGKQARDSGLFARFIVCTPQPIRGQRRYDLNSDNEWSLWQDAERRLAALARMNLLLLEDHDAEREVLEFSDAAIACWFQLRNEIEMHMGPNGRFYACPDHASKLADNVARVAALIHLFEERQGKIEIDILRMAIELCHYYSEHFQGVFLPPPQEIQDAYLLTDWFNELRQFNNRVIRYNDVRQRGPAQLRDKKRLKEAIDVLLAHNEIAVFTNNKTRYIDLMPNLGPIM